MKMTPEQAKKLLGDIRGRRVLVVGDVMLDEFIWGAARRIAPEAPVPVVEVERETRRRGGAANVAANVQSLGGTPITLGVIGADHAADLMRAEFRRLDLDPGGLIADASRPTTLKTRIVAHSQQIVRIDRESRATVSPAVEDRLIAAFNRLLPTVDAVAVSDYDKGALTPRTLEAMLPAAAAARTPLCLDPKLRNFRLYRPVTMLTPNHHEAEVATGLTTDNEASLVETANRIRALLGNPNVLVTLGEHGMALCATDGAMTLIPATAREVYDVTGAGDSVLAALTLALAAGASALDAAILSNHAAGVVVGKLGTATVSPQEILDAF
jgi:D-glycero-beta-D-manno-heptose-7-phosphate kinase